MDVRLWGSVNMWKKTLEEGFNKVLILGIFSGPGLPTFIFCLNISMFRNFLLQQQHQWWQNITQMIKNFHRETAKYNKLMVLLLDWRPRFNFYISKMMSCDF